MTAGPLRCGQLIIFFNLNVAAHPSILIPQTDNRHLMIDKMHVEFYEIRPSCVLREHNEKILVLATVLAWGWWRLAAASVPTVLR